MKTITNHIYVALASFALACFALSPAARATDLDGVLPGANNADGVHVLINLTTGDFNTGCGWFSLSSNQVGSANTGFGAATLFSNTGDLNTATGVAALFSNTAGNDNTATGALALFSNTTGGDNTATGTNALLSNTIGISNTADGTSALSSNIGGSNNTATGDKALFSNTGGSDNTGNGIVALYSNTIGSHNTAIGSLALYSETNVSDNTAIGFQALSATTNQGNTAVGSLAGAVSTGNFNAFFGYHAGGNVITANNVICIGANVGGTDDVSNATWIGNVYGVTTQSGTTAPVIVSDTGQLGTAASSERFKKDITTMDKASEVIMGLRPVTFHYKSDTKETPQFGLIAEEVSKVNPALVLPDKEGKPYTVRYDQVNAMLLNEFLKEHKKVEKLKKAVAQQRKDFQAATREQQRGFESKIAHQQKQIEALTAGLQRVSAQIEASKPAPQVVNNP